MIFATSARPHSPTRAGARRVCTPRRVADLELVVSSIVDELLDTLAASSGTVDLSVGFACAIPALVIAALLVLRPTSAIGSRPGRMNLPRLSSPPMRVR